jgi:hypothetical protein
MDLQGMSEIEDVEVPSVLQGVIARSVLKFVLVSFIEVINGKLSLRRADERQASIKLLNLGKHYFGEMTECSEHNIQLAATIMACSGLETLLMLACLCYRDRVMLSKSWRKNPKVKKHNSFLQNLERTELTTLIGIGAELDWFSADIPAEFSEKVDPAELADILTFVPSGESPSLVAATFAKDCRNRLHPGNCLRNDEDFEDSRSLTKGVAFVALALVSFFKQHDVELPSS